MTEVLAIDPSSPDPKILALAAECLRRGGLVAFPTETVYGLGVHALDPEALLRLFAAKARPANDPVIIHIADTAALEPLVTHAPPEVQRLASSFWPGPLTLVLRRSSRVPREVTAGGDTVAVRVPSHPIARALLGAALVPVAAPSANTFSRPSPTRAEHVLHDLDGRIDMILDGGPTEIGIESTVLDLTVDPPTVLRPGAVTLESLRLVLPRTVLRKAAAEGSGPTTARSPGLLEKHYAPRAPLTLYEGPRAPCVDRMLADRRAAVAQGLRVGVLATDQVAAECADAQTTIATLGDEKDPSCMATHLYDALRAFDGAEVDVILAVLVPHSEGLGPALRDRLHRAAAGRVVYAGSAP